MCTRNHVCGEATAMSVLRNVVTSLWAMRTSCMPSRVQTGSRDSAIQKSTVTAPLDFRPSKVGEAAVLHVSQTLTEEASSND